MKLFILEDNNIIINKEEILLVKEFADVFTLKFNTGQDGDKDGRKRFRAHKLFTYTYLMYDWQSPYSDYSDKERKEAALEDSELELKVLELEESQALFNKYLELQDTRLTKLLKSAYRAADELRLYFTLVDLQERDVESGKPIFSAKDLMSNLATMAKTVESLQQLEHMVKKEQEQTKSLRGGGEAGMFD